MALSNMATRVVTDRLPKVIKPKAHAILDYSMAASMLALGAFFWKRNKRAAVGAMICGGATIATALLTDYPGGLKPAISFETHGKIDAGMAGITATMPTFLNFGEEEEAKYFRGAALAETLIVGMTDFSSGGKVLEMPKRDLA
jgi:hypothetical protein